jgi:hypothetical protein
MKYLFRDPTLESLLSIVIVTSAVNSSLTALLGRAIIGKWFDDKVHQRPRKELEKVTYQNGFSCRYVICLVIYEIRISRARAVFITLYTLYFIANLGGRI